MVTAEEHVDVDDLVTNEQTAYAAPLAAAYVSQPMSPPEIPIRAVRSRPTNNQLL